MTEFATWIGWAVIAIGSVCAAIAVLTFVPYLILNRCWHYLKAQDDFLRIATEYMRDRKAKDRSIMGTPE